MRSEPIRCFFAVTPSAQNRELLAEARREFVAADPAWKGEKWVPLENLHLTLVFCPDLPPSIVDPLVGGLTDMLGRMDSFYLTLHTLGVRPRPSAAHVLWVDLLDSNRHCVDLAEAVRTAVGNHVELEETYRGFRPHITLCRARRRRPVAEEAVSRASATLVGAEQALRSMSVSAVTLFESRLGPAGPTYTARASVPLRID